MHSIHRAVIAGAITVCAAVLGCGAVMAQGQSDSATPAGSPAKDAAAPSAATPGLEAGAPAGVSRTETQKFINEVGYANRAEIALAHYAIMHTHSDLVKQFAQKMIADHTQANDRLTTIAMAHGYTTPLGVSREDRGALARLELNQGREFNAAYSRTQAGNQGEAVAMFKRAEQDPRIAPAVRGFARMRLPVLEDHLRMANQLVASQAQGNRSSG